VSKLYYIEVEDDGTGMFSKPKIVEMDETLLAMLITLRSENSEESLDMYDELEEETEEKLEIECLGLMMCDYDVIAEELHKDGISWNADEQGYVAVAYDVEKARKKIRTEIINECFDGEEW